MMKIALCSLPCLFAVLACGGVYEQPIGDAPGGAGSTPQTMDSGGTKAAVENAPDPSGHCRTTCQPGFACFAKFDSDDGVCAPLCDPDEPIRRSQTVCDVSINGSAGICVYGYAFLEFPLNETSTDSDPWELASVGLCSVACDPLAQDCPSGYTCDATDTFDGAVYACLPNIEPLYLGASCHAGGLGICGPGLTCTSLTGGCREFCELGKPGSCPGYQTCRLTDVTEQVSPAVGVCLDADDGGAP